MMGKNTIILVFYILKFLLFYVVFVIFFLTIVNNLICN